MAVSCNSRSGPYCFMAPHYSIFNKSAFHSLRLFWVKLKWPRASRSQKTKKTTKKGRAHRMHVVYGDVSWAMNRSWPLDLSMCEDDSGSECLCSGLWGSSLCSAAICLLWLLITPNSFTWDQSPNSKGRWSDWPSLSPLSRARGIQGQDAAVGASLSWQMQFLEK